MMPFLYVKETSKFRDVAKVFVLYVYHLWQIVSQLVLILLDKFECLFNIENQDSVETFAYILFNVTEKLPSVLFNHVCFMPAYHVIESFTRKKKKKKNLIIMVHLSLSTTSNRFNFL